MRTISAPPGGAPAKLDDVARLAGVSRSTASRAINGGDRVSPAAQAAVEQAISQLGFTPNRAARTLVTHRSDSVALVIPEPDELVLTDPFIGAVLRGLSAELHDTTTQLVLLIARPDEEHAKLAGYLRRGLVDGAIVASHHRGDVSFAAGSSGPPLVYIGRPWGTADGAAYVDVDSVTAAKVATEHLISAGCTEIAHLAGPADMNPGIDRLAGFQAALRAAGRPAGAYVHADFTDAGAEVAARELFAANPRIDGLFAASDTMAIAAMRVAAQLGRRVPRDLKVVGFDDLGAAATSSPALTTMVNPVVEMAKIACRLLTDEINGATCAPVILPSRLVVRATA